MKSNGDIRCDDDFGERVVLGKIAEEMVFSPSELFHNKPYSEIRAAYAADQPPWGKTCEKCAFFRDGKVKSTFFDKKITKIQLELTLLCSLKCPQCSRVKQIKEGRKPLVMTSGLLASLLNGLLNEGYSVERF